ncbi:MAG: hypothetical protein IH867_04325 [Chloroflexi bacterium]|nr:hypothetical protein [Chloroflexota bacterium]
MQFEVDSSSHSETSRLFRDLEKERVDIATELQRWDRGFLVRELVGARSGAFETLYATGKTEISNLLTFEKLLLLVNQVQPTGIHRNPDDLIRLVDQVSRLNNSESSVEDLQLGRTIAVKSRIMAHDNNGFFGLELAYMRAYNNDMEVYGLVSSGRISRDEIDEFFLYADIDFADYGIEADKEITDIARRFEEMALTGIQMTRMYNGHLWSSKMHEHKRNPLAVSVLHDWFLKCPELNASYLNKDPDLQGTLDTLFQTVPDADYSGADFIAEYVESPNLVPYAPRHPDGLLLDRMTLLMMCIYLYVQEVSPEYQSLSGYSKFQQVFSMKRSFRFTEWLEKRLIGRRYTVPIKEKVFSHNGVKREFDLVAVNESKNLILLIEAKYKDVPVISLNSENLVSNELEGKDGMLYELVRQNERKEFFVADSKRMAVECELESPFDEYAVQVFVVSKSSPILDSLDDVRWLRADKFLELIEG